MNSKTEQALAAIFRHCDEVAEGKRPPRSEEEGEESAKVWLGVCRVPRWMLATEESAAEVFSRELTKSGFPVQLQDSKDFRPQMLAAAEYIGASRLSYCEDMATDEIVIEWDLGSNVQTDAPKGCVQ